MPTPNRGIIVLNKPSGITSNAVLGAVKRSLKQKKMGFLGTLDPLAEGVLPLFIGKSTALIALFDDLSKTYRATVELGLATDSLDITGTIIEQRPVEGIELSQVNRILQNLTGPLRQRIPNLSARKINGVRSYKLARQGKPVPEKYKDVNIHSVSDIQLDLPHVTFTVSCSSGTYIRSIAEHIGTQLGLPACLSALNRILSGTMFKLEEAINLNDLQQKTLAKNYDFVRHELDFLSHLGKVMLSSGMVAKARHGQIVTAQMTVSLNASLTATLPQGLVSLVDEQKMLIGIGEIVHQQSDCVMVQPRKLLLD